MSLKKSVLALFLLPLSLALAGASSARAAGLYIGGGAYQADSDVGDDTVPGGFLGYTFLDTNFIMLSAEVGYYDLGDSSNRDKKAEASAITAGGVVSLPLGPFFELYAKAGVASADVKLETSERKNDKTSEEAYYGVGASLDILDTIDIYVEYLVFDTSINSDIAGVGVKLAF